MMALFNSWKQENNAIFYCFMLSLIKAFGSEKIIDKIVYNLFCL